MEKKPGTLTAAFVIMFSLLLPGSPSSAFAAGDVYFVRTQQGTTTTATTFSHAGSFAVQYEADNPNEAVRGAIVRYADEAVIALNYSDRTYVQFPLTK